MWLFLLTEVMFFGGLFTAYLIYRNWYYPAFVAGSHQLNIFWGTAQHAGAHHLQLHHGHGRVVRGDAAQERPGALPVLTFILGLGFLGIKTIEYHEKCEKHHVPGFHYSLQSFLDPASDAEVYKAVPATSRCRSTWRATPSSTSSSTSP